jgi:hypothetical protein
LLAHLLQLLAGGLLAELEVVEVLEPPEELEVFVEEEAVAAWEGGYSLKVMAWS